MELLGRWRRRADLTALTEPRHIAVVHVLDSLTVFKTIPRDSGVSILDIGSGGGFPGLVLKAADPSLSLALLDRDPKKIVFLKHVARELGLRDVKFLNIRVEQLIDATPSRTFDVVVSRSVFSDSGLFEHLASLLNPGGFLVRMAGPGSLHEPPELRGFSLIRVWEGILPFSDLFRRVLCYEVTEDSGA